jgi:hypothetical protein
MNVSELIEELKKYDPNTIVVVRGYEDGCNEIKEVSPTKVRPYPDPTWYYGEYEDHEEGQTAAVYLK